MELFGALLRRFRARAGLTLTELADALGADRKSLRLWEQGKRVPRDRARLDDLAQVLRLSSAEADQLAATARQFRLPPDREALPSVPPDDTTPPTAPLPALRHQLRAPIADFVGREHEVQTLVAALQAALAPGGGAVICGVQGMGGVGKTELAYMAAHRLRGAFPDAQLVLNLRGSSVTPLTPEQALQAVIRAFTPETKLPEDLAELEPLYRSVLHEKRVLILADDAGDGPQSRPLLRPAGCALLITSRQRFILPGMTTIDLEQLAKDEAVMLVRRICERLRMMEAAALTHDCGYLPLALRISSSMLRTDPALSVANYLARLGDERQRLAQLRDPDDPTLDVAASLTMSYAQLDGAAQHVFRQLGVLVADFATELAVAVAAPAEVDVEATLHLLLRRNLVMYDAQRGRWRLHDLVRDLALFLLAEAGEQAAAAWRYARAAIKIAQEAQDQYMVGGDAVQTALSRFDAERPHIDAGRRWAVIHAGTPPSDQLVLDAAAATRHIDLLRYDARHERIPLLECVLAAARRLGDQRAERSALNNLGLVYESLGDFHHALPYFEQDLTIARTLDDRRSEGLALYNVGIAYAGLGDIRRALPYYEQAAVIARALGDQRVEGVALHGLGNAYRKLGDIRRALPYFEQDLAIARALGDRRGEGITLLNVGHTYLDVGDAPRALESCMLSLTISRAIGDRRLEGYALSCLANLQAQQGDHTGATTAFVQALAIFRGVGDGWGEAECQWQFGLALTQQGEHARALPLLRTAVAYEQKIGHTKAAEHAALLVRLEAEEALPSELLRRANQRAIGYDRGAPPDAAQP